jgi:hypothetical protein
MKSALALALRWRIWRIPLILWKTAMSRRERSLARLSANVGTCVIESVAEFLRSFDNPMLLEGEQRILADLRQRRIEAPADREKALIRSLAATSTLLHFERIHKTIWAGQLTCLRALNTRIDGLAPEEIRPLYETAKAEYPGLYENYPFEAWMGFLERHGLLRHQNARAFITVEGREFLKFLVADGRYGPTHGRGLAVQHFGERGRPRACLRLASSTTPVP